MDQVAIIGIGCRFPKTDGPASFWRLLRDKIDAIGEVPPSRFDVNAFYDPIPRTPGRLISSWGGFVDDIDRFDARFFGISPHEAERMDPQQRLLLEVAWEAFEDAGVCPGGSTERVGVFVGMHASDYQNIQFRSTRDLDMCDATGGSRNAAAGRISRALDLRGPSLVVDSDRSSSLLAVHLAYRSLQSGECSLAIAGGANLVISPELGVCFSRAGMLAPDGRCKFGDVAADGFVRSDGVGLVVLKPLRRAVEEGDAIYAVLRGTIAQHDGGRSSDLMTPSLSAQIELLRGACADAGVDPSSVDYVEAHGTGTSVGDPIEVTALGTVYGAQHTYDRPLLVGSVKTNIGHTESAAGIAGLIKVCLALKHGEIPASLHFAKPNPKIPFEQLNVLIPREPRPWPGSGRQPLAGVSSFGLTGTSVHAILEAAPKFEARVEQRSRPFLFALSARSPEALHALAADSRSIVASVAPSELADLCHASTTRRTHLSNRIAMVGGTPSELTMKLDAYLRGKPDPGMSTGEDDLSTARLVFVFPGQGSQWLGMGRELLARESAFREALEACDVAMRPVAGWSILDELLATEAHSRLDQPEILQPVLLAVEIALAAQWQAWGITPDVVVGTDIGELAAAYVAGALSLDDVFHIICERTRLMSGLRGHGAAVVVGASVNDCARLLEGVEDRVAIAMSNSPTSTVLSGDQKALEEIVARVKRQGVICEWVKVDVASHSPQMDSICPALSAALSNIQPRACATTIYSSVTATPLPGTALGGEYWVRNLRQPVLLASVVQNLISEGMVTFLEISPHPILSGPLLDGVEQSGREALVLASLRRREPEREQLLRTVAQLFVRGHSVDWQRIQPRSRQYPLPPYPWRREAFWLPDASATSPEPAAAAPVDSPERRSQKSDRQAERPSMAEPAAAVAVDSERRSRRPARQSERPSMLPHAPTLAAELREAPANLRRDLLVSFLEEQVARILGLRDKPDLRTPLRELGLTSIMDADLRSVLGRALGKTFPVSLFFNYPHIDALASHLVEAFSSPAMPRAGALGAILVDCGAVTEHQLARALEEQARSGGRERLGAVLVRLGAVTPLQLREALLVQTAEPIAIIGMACRFPGGANSPERFWDLLERGDDAIREVPPERWNVDAFYDPDPDAPGKMNTRWGGFIDEVDGFDATFFGISQREAEFMDPQQRLLLEAAWHSLEDAGLAPDRLVGTKTGVFIGMMSTSDYLTRMRLSDDPKRILAHMGTGNESSIAAGRISYLLGLQGPAMAIDTACSSSLVAVHLAATSLRSGECRIALAGGVNLVLSPEYTIAFSKARMMSPDGRCKTFDARANGYVRGDGCGVIVLKRLSDALASGDNVLAVLLGTAINQDGRSSGLTAPNGRAQEDVIRDALAVAGVKPAEIGYVETHGTGTPLGDPIEVQALGAVLGPGRDSASRLAIGSVKTNIGHTESAAGIAGLVKVVLAIKHKQIPKSLHFENPNPQIALEEIPAFVPTSTIPWTPENGARRIAGVSSFGFSGTNAHVIVAEPPSAAIDDAQSNARQQRWPVQIVTLSARTPLALAALATRYDAHLRTHEEIALADLALTANTGRAHLPNRCAIVARSTAELMEGLAAHRDKREHASLRTGRAGGQAPKIAFLFTGQGSQYRDMGRVLYEAQPLFRRTLDEADAILRDRLGEPLLSVLFRTDGEASPINDTAYAQPALFALEYGLASLWRTWGIEPSYVIGHSLGELVAACFAGVFSFEEGLKLVAERGRLMQSCPKDGAMGAIRASEERVAAEIEAAGVKVAMAAINGPESVVISGRTEAVEAVLARCVTANIWVQRLTVSHAFHSELMAPAIEPFGEAAANVAYAMPRIGVVSNLTGKVESSALCSPKYWRDHTREPVQFQRGMMALREAGCDLFLEVGPNPVLVGMGMQCLPDHGTWLPSMKRGRDDRETLLHAAADLYVTGCQFDWEAFYRDQPLARRLPLPTYPFEHKRFWFEVVGRGDFTPAPAASDKGKMRHPLLRKVAH